MLNTNYNSWITPVNPIYFNLLTDSGILKVNGKNTGRSTKNTWIQRGIACSTSHTLSWFMKDSLDAKLNFKSALSFGIIKNCTTNGINQAELWGKESARGCERIQHLAYIMFTQDRWVGRSYTPESRISSCHDRYGLCFQDIDIDISSLWLVYTEHRKLQAFSVSGQIAINLHDHKGFVGGKDKSKFRRQGTQTQVRRNDRDKAEDESLHVPTREIIWKQYWLYVVKCESGADVKTVFLPGRCKAQWKVCILNRNAAAVMRKIWLSRALACPPRTPSNNETETDMMECVPGCLHE